MDLSTPVTEPTPPRGLGNNGISTPPDRAAAPPLHEDPPAQDDLPVTVIDRRPAADGDESVFDVVHMGKYIELDRPRRLVFEFSVLTFGSEDPTRVTVDITPVNPQACELTLTHDMGTSEQARMMEEASRKGWLNMLQLIERELFPRRVGVHL